MKISSLNLVFYPIFACICCVDLCLMYAYWMYIHVYTGVSSCMDIISMYKYIYIYMCVCKYLHLYLYTCLIWYLHVCGCALHVWPFGIVMINRWNWKCRVFGFSHHFQTNPFWPFLMLRGKGLLARVPDVVINFFCNGKSTIYRRFSH